MRIGIDIDDTISDTYDSLFHFAQKYTIEELKRSGKIDLNQEMKTHMYCSDLHHWNEQEEKNFFDKYYKTVVKEVKPKKFSAEVIEKLKKQGHEIYIITARFESDKFDIKEETKDWLDKNHIYYDKLFVNIDKKAKVASENKVDIFIDDSFQNCQEVANKDIKTYIFDTRINEKLQHNKIERIYSWPHFYQEINKELEKKKI